MPDVEVHKDAFVVQRHLLTQLGVQQPTILDIGANVGQTVDNYRQVFPGATIYCFEPYPASIAALRQRFGHDPHVRIVPMCVADAPGSRALHVNDRFSGTNSLLPRPAATRRYFPRDADLETTVDVPATTLDDFIRAESIDRVDILKLDIQGGELNALKGATRALTEKRIPLIYLEAFFVPHYENSPLLHHLWGYLAGFGYSFYNMYKLVVARNGQLRFADVIFVHRDLRTRILDAYPEEP